ncbi:MAG: VOC family protein [Desulfitobacteriaceae bacterium]
MIDALRIDHICLIVSNLEKSREYFEKLFNVSCKFHPRDKNTLMAETNKIHFFLKEVNMPFEFYENQHLSFEVINIDSIEEKLKENNIKDFEIGTFDDFQYNNYKWLEWRGPDNIRLECIQKI